MLRQGGVFFLHLLPDLNYNEGVPLDDIVPVILVDEPDPKPPDRHCPRRYDRASNGLQETEQPLMLDVFITTHLFKMVCQPCNSSLWYTFLGSSIIQVA